MEKNIKDYLHLYIGCQCHDIFNDCDIILSPSAYAGYMLHWLTPEDCQIKPILRRLSDMTTEEIIDCARISNCLPAGWEGSNYMDIVHPTHPNEGIEVRSCGKYGFRITNVGAIYFYDYDKKLCIYAPRTEQVILYLLSKHFDLFELIESGLAIDKTIQTA